MVASSLSLVSKPMFILRESLPSAAANVSTTDMPDRCLGCFEAGRDVDAASGDRLSLDHAHAVGARPARTLDTGPSPGRAVDGGTAIRGGQVAWGPERRLQHALERRRRMWRRKRVVDLAGAILLLPLLIVACVGLLLFNPMWNRGPLFFRQWRMGARCRPFRVIKFRSMAPARAERRYDEPVEAARITPLGHWIRRTRLDELPQIINVLRGEMSLVGPRPDAWEHAVAYSKRLPHYHLRHLVPPGISGLAQVRLGYVEDMDAVRRKVRQDLTYLCKASWGLELRIMLSTLRVVATGRGSK